MIEDYLKQHTSKWNTATNSNALYDHEVRKTSVASSVGLSDDTNWRWSKTSEYLTILNIAVEGVMTARAFRGTIFDKSVAYPDV